MEDLEKLANEVCDGDEDCLQYLADNCDQFNGYPSQMDYMLTGKECLTDYARKFKELKEKEKE